MSEHSRQIGDLGDPSTIDFLLDLDSRATFANAVVSLAFSLRSLHYTTPVAWRNLRALSQAPFSRQARPLVIRFGYFLFLLMSAPALATDYIIRVETTGYVNEVVEENSPEPKERSLRTTETICRIGQPFRARMTVGNETTTLSGVLRKSDDPESDFSVEVKHSHIVALSATVRHGTVWNTKVAVVQRESLKTATLISTTDTTAEGPTQKRTSKISFAVTVEEYDPNLTKEKLP